MPTPRIAIFGLLLWVSACGGGGGGSAPPPTTPPPVNTGTAATMDTSVNFNLSNLNSGLLLDIDGSSQTAASAAVQTAASGSQSQLWHFIPAAANQYKIVNANSGQVLGISAAATTSGAAALQYADNGTNDHLWEVLSVGGGQYKIQNINSGLLLDISSASRSAGADVVQSSDSGTSSQLWTLTAAGVAYVGPGAITGNTSPVHDPSMIKTGTTYLLFATGGGIEQRTSADRTNFAPAITEHAFISLPQWTAPYTNGTDLWAPDVSFNAGQYYLYFAASTFGSSNSAIGLATSPTGAVGTWVDSGSAILNSATCAGSNAIDPAFVGDASGNWWLAFGSFFNGINMVQLDPSTGKPLGAAPTCYSLAQRTGTAIEGSTVYLHNGMYYLFASVDVCCQGVSSTYHIVVGRSSNPQGPYVDRGGIPMSQGGGTILLATHGNIIGPGGQDVFNDTDGDVLVYHYYDGNNAGTPTLGINLLGWTSDGWPFVH
ncbi:MAG TPA: family 43 glycosylhydrolase [Steroidobacteraceae bacterium]|nr:family 43 glycosylhydrolase [Steroidobacteraceae bacterium]